MSAPSYDKYWVLQHDKAIECLVKHPTYALRVVGQIYRMKAEDLQGFLDQFNGGDRALTAARLQEIRQELGILSTGPAPAPARVVKPDPQRERAVVIQVHSARKPSSVPPLAKEPPAVAAAFPRPWEGRNFFPKTFQRWRPYLVKWAARPEASAADIAPDVKERNTLQAYKLNCLGKGPINPKQIAAFIEWGDHQLTADGLERAQRAREVHRAQPPARQRSVEPAPRVEVAIPMPTGADGWQELQVLAGGSADYAARFSGAKVKIQRISFSQRCVPALKAAGIDRGAKLRVLFNPAARRLRLAPADAGLKLRGRSPKGLCLGCNELATLLGREPIVFDLANTAETGAIEFQVRGGAS